MAKDLIDEIKEAEARANDIVKEAQLSAVKIVDDANSQAKKMLEFSSKEAKSKGNSLVATAENNSYKKKLKAQESIEKEVAQVIENATPKIDDAVNLIISEIIPK